MLERLVILLSEALACFYPFWGYAALRLDPSYPVGITSRPEGSHLVVRQIQKTRHKGGLFVYGALGRIRTFDRPVRSRVLYPAELRVRFGLISEVAHYR